MNKFYSIHTGQQIDDAVSTVKDNSIDFENLSPEFKQHVLLKDDGLTNNDVPIFKTIITADEDGQSIEKQTLLSSGMMIDENGLIYQKGEQTFKINQDAAGFYYGDIPVVKARNNKFLGFNADGSINLSGSKITTIGPMEIYDFTKMFDALQTDEVNSHSSSFKIGRLNSDANYIDSDVINTLEIIGVQTFEYAPNNNFKNWTTEVVDTATGQVLNIGVDFTKNEFTGHGTNILSESTCYKLASFSSYHAYKFTFRALTTDRSKISLRILCDNSEVAYYDEGSNYDGSSFASLIRSNNTWKDFTIRLDQPVHGNITFEFKSSSENPKEIYIAKLEIEEAQGVFNKPNATYIEFQNDEVISRFQGEQRFRYNSELFRITTNAKFDITFDNGHEQSTSRDTLFKIDRDEHQLDYISRGYRAIHLATDWGSSWIDNRRFEEDSERWNQRRGDWESKDFKIYNEGEFEVAAYCLPNGRVPDSDEHLIPSVGQPLAAIRLSDYATRLLVYEGSMSVGAQYCGTKADPEEENNFFSFRRYADKGETINAGLRIANPILYIDGDRSAETPAIKTEVYASPIYSNRKFFVRKNVGMGIFDSYGNEIQAWGAKSYPIPAKEFAILKVTFFTSEPNTQVNFSYWIDDNNLTAKITDLDVPLPDNLNQDRTIGESIPNDFHSIEPGILVPTPGTHHVYLKLENTSTTADVKKEQFELDGYFLNNSSTKTFFKDKTELINTGYVRLPRVGIGIARIDGEIQQSLDNDNMCMIFKSDGVIDIRNVVDKDSNYINPNAAYDAGAVRFISERTIFKTEDNKHEVLVIDQRNNDVIFKELNGPTHYLTEDLKTLSRINTSVSTLETNYSTLNTNFTDFQKITAERYTQTVITATNHNSSIINIQRDIETLNTNLSTNYLPKLGGIITGNDIIISAGIPRPGGITMSANQMAIGRNGIAITNPAIPNDAAWIRILGTGEKDTVLEIATGDDSTLTDSSEEIVVRKYSVSSHNTHDIQLKLLDKQNNTSIPGNLTVNNINLRTGEQDIYRNSVGVFATLQDLNSKYTALTTKTNEPTTQINISTLTNTFDLDTYKGKTVNLKWVEADNKKWISLRMTTMGSLFFYTPTFTTMFTINTKVQGYNKSEAAISIVPQYFDATLSVYVSPDGKTIFLGEDRAN